MERHETIGVSADGGYLPKALDTNVLRVLADAKVNKHIATEGAEPLPTTADEYAADIDREETKWSALVKKSGAQQK